MSVNFEDFRPIVFCLDGFGEGTIYRDLEGFILVPIDLGLRLAEWLGLPFEEAVLFIRDNLEEYESRFPRH